MYADEAKSSSRLHAGGTEEVWDRWKRGESLKSIGRVFGKQPSSVYHQLAPYGGIRPRPPRRSCWALTLSEREEISRGIAAHQAIRSIAGLLGRSPSTVSREIRRNGGDNDYRAAEAMSKPGRGPAGRSGVSWSSIHNYDG